jgi:hypothetical protein
MAVETTINDGLIDRVTLYKPLYWLFRIDVFPFLTLYLICSLFIIQNGPLKFPALICFPVVLTCHLFVFLFAQSSVSFRCFIGKKETTDIESTVYIHVHAAKNVGKDRLVPLLRIRLPQQGKDGQLSMTSNDSIKVLGDDYGLTSEVFSFQEVKYCYNSANKSFYRIDYPIEIKDNTFLKWEGYTSNEIIMKSFQRWGINEFNIPMPHFLDLYMVRTLLDD